MGATVCEPAVAMNAVIVSSLTHVEVAALPELIGAGVPAIYSEVVVPHTQSAARNLEGEERILVARDRPGGAVTGFVLYGLVPGTSGAGRIRAVIVAPLARRRGVGRALLEAACDALERMSARFVMMELPDEPLMTFLTALIVTCGFAEEARAADLVAPGVAMRYFRRPLGGGAGQDRVSNTSVSPT